MSTNQQLAFWCGTHVSVVMGGWSVVGNKPFICGHMLGILNICWKMLTCVNICCVFTYANTMYNICKTCNLNMLTHTVDILTTNCRSMGRATGTSSRSLSSWRQSRVGNINTRKCSICLCPACGPRGRRVTARTFDTHTSRIWTGLLRRNPEPLGALYEQYRSRMRDGDTSTSDLDDVSDIDQFDGCLSDQDPEWHGVDLDADGEPGVDVGIEPAAAPPAPLHDREPGDEFRSPHAPAYTRTCAISG